MQRKPDWLRVRLSDTKNYNSVNEVIEAHKLNTVCEGANCLVPVIAYVLTNSSLTAHHNITYNHHC